MSQNTNVLFYNHSHFTNDLFIVNDFTFVNHTQYVTRFTKWSISRKISVTLEQFTHYKIEFKISSTLTSNLINY